MRLYLVAKLLAGITIAATAVLTRADGSWLDGPLVSWNTVGAPIPTAPPPDVPLSNLNNSFCAGTSRTPETPEDSLVAQAGWTLFGAYESGWGVKVIGGGTGMDGMCRPEGYQVFVFVDGTFAGRLPQFRWIHVLMGRSRARP